MCCAGYHGYLTSIISVCCAGYHGYLTSIISVCCAGYHGYLTSIISVCCAGYYGYLTSISRFSRGRRDNREPKVDYTTTKDRETGTGGKADKHN